MLFHLMIFCFIEEAPHMRDLVIEETMYDMDKNRDGKITLEEYISKPLLPLSLCVSLMTTINYFVFSLFFLLLLGDIWPQF